MPTDATETQPPLTYGEYLRMTAKAPLNVALALLYVVVAVACFAFGHTVWGVIVVMGGVVIWLRPVYYVAWKLHQTR